MMVGAKNFVGLDGGVQFSIGSGAKGRINKVVIKLDPSDTYTVEFWRVNTRTYEMVKVDETSNVYNDSLMNVFEAATGMYLTFGRRS